MPPASSTIQPSVYSGQTHGTPIPQITGVKSIMAPIFLTNSLEAGNLDPGSDFQELFLRDPS